MPKTDRLKQVTSAYHGRFEIKQYLLDDMIRFFVVNDTNPKDNLWSSTCYILNFDGNCIAVDPGFINFDETHKLISIVGIEKCDVLLTHGHYDHWYGAMRTARNGNIFIHQKDSEYVLGISTDPEKNRQLAHDLAVTRWEPKLKYDFIRNAAELDLVRLKTTPLREQSSNAELPHGNMVYFNDGGHTPGHTVYIFRGIVFAGDLLVNGTKWYLDFMYGKGKGENKRNLRKIKKDCEKSLDTIINHIKFDYIALGHGGIFPRDEIRKIARKLLKK